MADTTERLLLQVDAATELLRRHMAEGEQPLARFEQRAATMASNVDRSIGSMGGKLGAFATLAEDAATRAQRAFDASFSDIQKLAAKAIEAPTVRGGVNIGAADARAAADAAQRQAVATRLIAEAAERAAAGEGVLTEQTRLYVQAARAAAIESDRHASELLREAGALERLQIELNQTGAGAQLLAMRQSGATNSAGALRAAMQGASYQVQDTFTQLSMGANVLQVVAIQGGQVAGQFANIEGKAGSFARFMIGPYGLAVTAALLVLGPLTKGMFEFGDATDEAVDKLKQDATETDVAARAKARFGGSVEGVTAALKEQDKALRQTAESERSSAERANVAAQNKRNEALAIRQRTAATLADAVAQQQALQAAAGDQQRYGRGESASIAAQIAAGRVTALQAQLATANSAVTDAERQLNVSRVDLAAERAAISLDPVRAVTRLYDDRINAVKNQQREEARLGRQVGTESAARLRQLEAEKRAAIETAQAKERASNAKPNNNQLGREITVADARSIVASIGGHVTSGTRSNERQQQLYADYLAGRHKGPVAKPGTSDHERGQAVDVAYGPGISIASIREAFRKQGVALRQIIDEPAQRVIHVAFGKKGPSAETIANKAETARQKLISDDLAYTDQERAARQRLLAATRKGADSEEAKEAAAVEGAEVERNATRQKIADQLSAKRITQAQADHLSELNEATYTQQLQNQIVARATRQLDRQYDVAAGDLQSQLAILRINQDLATTAAERRRIARQILDAEQKARRDALLRTRDTSQDPGAVQTAKDELGRLPAVERAEDGAFGRQQTGQLDQYRQRLHAATDDMNDALQGVAVQGFGALENAGSQAIGSAVTNLLHLRGVAGNVIGGVISDLARLAIEKAIVKAIGGSFFGLAGGGEISELPGFADGGSPGGQITGPGTGTSDSILAILGGGKGAIRVSTEEFIVNAKATKRNLPLLHAINSGRLPGYADGGYLASPSIPTLRSPALPRMTGMGSRSDRLVIETHSKVDASPLLLASTQEVAVRTVSAAAEPIMSGAESRTMTRLRRPSLPGAPG